MASFVFVKAVIHHIMPVMTFGALVSQSFESIQLWRRLYQAITASIYLGFVMV